MAVVALLASVEPPSSHEKICYQCNESHPECRFDEAAEVGTRLTGNARGDGTGSVHTRSK
jgi:hypothetical protein